MSTWNNRGGDESAAEVLFEFTQIGPQMRIAAIDVKTSTEVVVIAPASASRADMQLLALNKLKLRLRAAGRSS